MRETMTYHSVLRRQLPGIVLATMADVALIALGSPLFRTLGFEYSALSALVLSMIVPFAAATEIDQDRLTDRHAWQTLGAIAVLYSLLPLLVSLLSLVAIANCAFTDGLLFYLEIVPLTVIIGMLIGILCAVYIARLWLRRLAIALIWVVTLGLGFVPGYRSAQIYSLSWQYGFFPGFVWDEYIRIRPQYWAARIHDLVYPIFLLLLALRARSKHWWRIAALAVVVVLFVMVGNSNTPSANVAVVREDGKRTAPLTHTETIGNVRVHYSASAFTDDEAEYLRAQIRHAQEEIEAYLHLPHRSTPLDIYIYDSVDDMDEYVGTRSASISKPWQATLYIARENLRSLKHELTHVMLASYGRFPFDVSYSTGLTEGVAEATASEFDGIHSLDELAASILEMHYADGVTGVMAFTGFASNASSNSYVLAGSFSSYLIRRYGPQKYLDCYTTRDFERCFGKSLEALDAEWKNDILKHPQTFGPFDSVRLRYYFDRRSIIADPCLRRIGSLMHNARLASSADRYREADSIYATVLHEGDRSDALSGRVYSLMRLGDFAAALAVLDTTNLGSRDRMLVPQHVLRGDLLLIITRDTAAAMREWRIAAALQLGSDQFLNAMARLWCVGGTRDLDSVINPLKEAYREGHPFSIRGKRGLLLPRNDNDTLFLIGRSYLRSRQYASVGRLRLQAIELFRCVELLGQYRRSHHGAELDLFTRLTTELSNRLDAVFHTSLSASTSEIETVP